MEDQRKAKKQLIEELIALRQQLAKWNAAPTPSCPHHNMDEPQRSSALLPKPHACLWEGEFKSLVENSPDAIIRFDKDLRFLYANKVALKVMRIPLASCLGKTVSELKFPRKYYKLWKSQVETIFQTKQQAKFEAEFTSSKEHHFYYHARLVPEFSIDGSVVSVLCTLRNIDELKKTVGGTQCHHLFFRAVLKHKALKSGKVAQGYLTIIKHIQLREIIKKSMKRKCWKSFEKIFGCGVSKVCNIRVTQKYILQLRCVSSYLL